MSQATNPAKTITRKCPRCRPDAKIVFTYSSSMTSRHASAAAHAIGLPPYEVDAEMLSNDSLCCDRVTIAVTGKPLPKPLPSVTASGSAS